MSTGPVYTRRFGEFGIGDIPTVGGKTAGLGEMYRSLSSEGVRVPDGFAITADAYRHVLEAADALGPLHAALDGLDPDDLDDLARRAERARAIVYDAGLPGDLADEIEAGYRSLQDEYGEHVGLAVRSSATAEDLPTASFAGQQETFLNVPGVRQAARGLPEVLRQPLHRPVGPLPGRPGVRPVPGGAVDRRHEDGAVRHRLVGGDVHPRHRVRLPRRGLRHRLLRPGRERRAGRGRPRRVLRPQAGPGRRPPRRAAAPARRQGAEDGPVDGGPGHTTANVPTPDADRVRFCLADADVLELADCAVRIEAHFGHPMDIEWAKDGIDGELYIVQARPETIMSQRQRRVLETYVLDHAATSWSKAGRSASGSPRARPG